MAGKPLGILLISGGHERAHYAFVIASGAAAVGREVILFATNQGCRALLADLADFADGDAAIAARGVASLAELREACQALDVRMIACEAGLRAASIEGPLLDGVEVAGVVSFLEAVGSGQMISL
jgi:uncharacterized protein